MDQSLISVEWISVHPEPVSQRTIWCDRSGQDGGGIGSSIHHHMGYGLRSAWWVTWHIPLSEVNVGDGCLFSQNGLNSGSDISLHNLKVWRLVVQKFWCEGLWHFEYDLTWQRGVDNWLFRCLLESSTWVQAWWSGWGCWHAACRRRWRRGRWEVAWVGTSGSRHTAILWHCVWECVRHRISRSHGYAQKDKYRFVNHGGLMVSIFWA